MGWRELTRKDGGCVGGLHELKQMCRYELQV